MFDCNAVIAYCSGGVLSISWLLRVRALPWIRLNERLNNRNLLTFIGFVHSWSENSSSCRGPYSHESASLNIDENENENDGSQGDRGGRGSRSSRSKSAGSGSGSASENIGLDSVEAFSFFDDEEEDDDSDSDSDSGSEDDDNDNGQDPEGVLDPFGTHEDANDDAEYYDDEDEEKDKSRLQAYHSDSAWLWYAVLYILCFK